MYFTIIVKRFFQIEINYIIPSTGVNEPTDSDLIAPIQNDEQDLVNKLFLRDPVSNIYKFYKDNSN